MPEPELDKAEFTPDIDAENSRLPLRVSDSLLCLLPYVSHFKMISADDFDCERKKTDAWLLSQQQR